MTDSERQAKSDYAGLWKPKKFRFYSKHNGKPLEVFRHSLVNTLIEVFGG